MFIELTQKHIEDWVNALPDINATKSVVYLGAILRAAAKAGWFIEPIKPEDVDKMPPAKVRTLAEAVSAEFNRVMEISPE